MKVPPAATKSSISRCEVASSASLPKVIVPRQSAETAQPLLPSFL